MKADSGGDHDANGAHRSAPLPPKRTNTDDDAGQKRNPCHGAAALGKTCRIKHHNSGGVSNPQVNTDRSANENWLRDNFAQKSSYYHANTHENEKNPFALEVINTGGCHSRAYQVQDWQWQYVSAFEKAKVELIQCHRRYYDFCKTNQDTMCTVIDQAKYLDEVQEYWSDIDQSVLVSGDNLSTNLAVVSEDRLAQLKAMANNRRAKDDIVVVSKLQNQA